MISPCAVNLSVREAGVFRHALERFAFWFLVVPHRLLLVLGHALEDRFSNKLVAWCTGELADFADGRWVVVVSAGFGSVFRNDQRSAVGVGRQASQIRFVTILLIAATSADGNWDIGFALEGLASLVILEDVVVASESLLTTLCDSHGRNETMMIPQFGETATVFACALDAHTPVDAVVVR